MGRIRWTRALVFFTGILVSPVAASAQAAPATPAAAPAKPAAAEPAPPVAAAQATVPLARAHRLAISLSFGFGSAAMGSFEDFTKAVPSMVRPQPTLDGELASNLQINAEVSFRYYFPYFVLAQVGYGAIYNWSTVGFAIGGVTGEVEYHNLAMEIPILVGGYYVFIDRLYVYGAVGPSPFFFARSYWDLTGPGISVGLPDFKADSGVGFTGLGGADFMVGETFGVGLELRYRYLKASTMKELKTGASPGGSYDLDFSGISLGFHLRLFAM